MLADHSDPEIAQQADIVRTFVIVCLSLGFGLNGSFKLCRALFDLSTLSFGSFQPGKWSCVAQGCHNELKSRYFRFVLHCYNGIFKAPSNRTHAHLHPTIAPMCL